MKLFTIFRLIKNIPKTSWSSKKPLNINPKINSFTCLQCIQEALKMFVMCHRTKILCFFGHCQISDAAIVLYHWMSLLRKVVFMFWMAIFNARVINVELYKSQKWEREREKERERERKSFPHNPTALLCYSLPFTCFPGIYMYIYLYIYITITKL